MYDLPHLLREPLLLRPLRRSLEEGAPPAFLRSVKIKVTARCNLRCRMCRYGRGLKLPELGTERMLGVLDEIAEVGARKVHFSGGEVLSRSDFEALVGRAADRGLKVTLTSNLTLMTKARAKALMAHKISSISTSIDGATAKSHEAVRGVPGSFKKTLRALALLRRERERRGQRTRLRVNFTVMRSNFREYPEVIRLAGEAGASDVLPMPVDTKKPELRLTKSLIREYNEEIAPRAREARARFGMPMGERMVHPFGEAKEEVAASAQGLYAGAAYDRGLCYAPWLHLFIAWDGKVYLCCMTNGRIEALGDLSRQSVGEVFRGERFQAIRAQMLRERLPQCHQCDMYLEENRMLAEALGPVSAPAAREVPKKLRVLG